MTRQLVMVLAVLLGAYVRGEELHGYAIMKAAGLSGPSTYRNLDRLEDAQLVEARWEDLREVEDRPRRIYYQLNPAGAAAARAIVAERRPDLLKNPPSPVPAPRPRLGTIFSAARLRARGAS